MNSVPRKKPNQIPEWILQKMRHYCAYQERSIFEVKTKLNTFHLQAEIYDDVINQLIKEDYLNEERFARVFASGKLRINKWGRNKIYLALQQKRIPELFILEGLNEIEESEYIKVLNELIAKKNRELSGINLSNRTRKLVNFAVARGFEPRLVWDVINKLKE